MTASLKLTLAQINPAMGDLDSNREKILAIWKDSKADLVVFPELALCGYPPEDLVLKPLFLRKIEETVQALCDASRLFSAAAIISCPWIIDERVRNALHVIENGRITHTQAKHTLPNYGVFDEKRIFTAGPLPEPVNFRGHRLGLIICEDLWFPDVAAHMKNNGAEILIAANASPFDLTKFTTRQEIARARVKETGLPVTYVNLVGGQDELVFDGGSFMMDASGRIVVQMPRFEEYIFDHPGTATAPKTPEDENEILYKALCLGLQDYLGKNGFPGVIIGLSGGIDSAISAVIAADAIGAENVHCVMMPSRFTSQDSLDDAAALAENLGCKYEIISIEKPLAAIEHIIDLKNLAHENTQSRLRGLILMALSNTSGKMVLTTGNKSEMAVGYATLYGDMNGGFNILKDVYKTKVYALSRWRAKQDSTIPNRIIEKTPSAELRENQKDQDSLPPYDVLDDILECLVENNMDVHAITERGHDHETIIKVWKMLDRAEYKRRQAPPGVKITPRAFGRDRRYPITNGFSKLIEKPD